jgi:ribosomal protein S18 acetylase RimI-like enzyme
MVETPAITLRALSTADVETLQAIGVQSFTEAFAHLNNPEDFRAYLDKAFHTEQLRSELANLSSSFFLATAAGAPVGYLKVNFGNAQTEPQGDDAMEIERIYALAAWHGKGVGEALLKKALSLAREKEMQLVWLGVWEENPKAIRFYQKHGFEVFGKHHFWLGQDLQHDLLMRLFL